MADLPFIRRVEQKHVHGCAVAAIASVVGVSYEAVMRKAFGPYHYRVYNPGLYTTNIIKLIRSFGLKVRKTNSLNKKLPAILMLNLRDGIGGDLFHCVVWDPAFGGRFVDPGWSEPEDRKYYYRTWNQGKRETLVITGRNN